MGPLDRSRLEAVAAQLTEPVAQVALTLGTELSAERARLGAGLEHGDLTLVADAVHAARNSALMIDATPTLAGLRELQRAVRAEQLDAAKAAAARLEPELVRLLEALRELSRG